MPKFIIRLPNGGETAFSTENEDIFIGRIQSINDICIGDPSVSRQHAHVKKREEGYTIYDLKSLSGVILNGKRVAKAVLKHGDRLQLGDVTVEVRLEDYSSEEVLRSIEQSERTEAEVEFAPREESTHPGLTIPIFKNKPSKKKKK
ncbi:MAG: FHA domain-containing protein [Pseudomonadota bacterium]